MNPFKEAVAAGRPQIGLWQALASPYTAEICAGAGFDWLLIDAEHGPNDLPLVLQQLQAVAASPVEPVVRLPVGDPVLIKQYLDLGARSLLIPMVESNDQAARMVAATRYPPEGIRGVGSAIGRASRWNRTPGYLHQAQQEICLMVQIESVAGLDQLEAIAATPGIDGVFVGPSDLAAALGHLGDPGHAEVQQAIEDAIARLKARDMPSGMLIADERLARRYLELGACFVAVGTDVTILARGAEALARRFGAGGAALASPVDKTSVY
ncbi:MULTISPECIES: 4-hydroxy-2-oxoheptanedioate aldolase [unclassified Sphingomonas]|uniref:4-hydroxy-2-oxoheptanedioate aldolase n=1 Tax=unclassified Sphingomonas TaxID=196159 RepID=UPI0006FF1941|nr:MULTISPECIES: 4-hydroxy-2-oxoheptanedioate aldolase [unclassified Sphingomonas]KQX23498.1 2-dehydro-3-deoxyglucarate aldolase [Sphingomonas sp. Root1294]KQY68348.1 2-dehydro-3-deoxyglucarate aldolase [Sphingomonas sp. Root50]KRB91250.1 2-dehydro-3-deoxyglucarate aldolase [Sphingomonas sp. Root720]